MSIRKTIKSKTRRFRKSRGFRKTHSFRKTRNFRKMRVVSRGGDAKTSQYSPTEIEQFKKYIEDIPGMRNEEKENLINKLNKLPYESNYEYYFGSKNVEDTPEHAKLNQGLDRIQDYLKSGMEWW